MVGVHGALDASPYVVDGGMSVEVGGEQYTECNATLKRGSGAQSNIAEGHLLVAEEQPLWSTKRWSSSSVSWTSCSPSKTLMRGGGKVEPRPKVTRMWGIGAYSRRLPLITNTKIPLKMQKNQEIMCTTT